MNGEEVPSSIALYRITTSLIRDADEAFDQLTQLFGEDKYRTTLGAYTTQGHHRIPSLNALLELHQLLASETFAHGPTRTLIGMIDSDPLQAMQRYKRFKKMVEKREPGSWERFQNALQNCLPDSTADPDLPFLVRDCIHQSPLGDLFSLRSVMTRISEDAA